MGIEIDAAVVYILIAFVLDGDGRIGSVRADRHGIRLPTQIEGSDQGTGGNVDHGQLARGVGEASGGVHAHQRVVASHRNRGGLSAQGQGAQGGRGFRGADVQETDHALGAVGVDQSLPVVGHIENFRGGFSVGIAVCVQLRAYRQGGDPNKAGDRSVTITVARAWRVVVIIAVATDQYQRRGQHHGLHQFVEFHVVRPFMSVVGRSEHGL